MEKKWDTVIPADLKRLFESGTYICPAGHERVNTFHIVALKEYFNYVESQQEHNGV